MIMEAYRMLILNESGDKEAVYMRLAEFKDLEKLNELYQKAWGTDEQEVMEEWLEQGGAMLITHSNGQILGALRWQEQAPDGEGWQLDRIATLPDYRSQGFGRWLITKVEALAIEHNIPSLSLELENDSETQQNLLPYYQRLGYQEQDRAEGTIYFSKQVGGMWQMQS